MKFPTLPLLNALGCLLLVSLVVAQWQRERVTQGELVALRAGLVAATTRAAEESKRRGALERDLGVLKEAIAATQQAAETTARDLTGKSIQVTELQAELATAREQVAAWETALKNRDERIAHLSADLTATRERLAEAIAKLKAAGAR